MACGPLDLSGLRRTDASELQQQPHRADDLSWKGNRHADRRADRRLSREGLCVAGLPAPGEVLEDIREAHTQLLARHPEHPEFRDNCSALLSYDLRFLNYARDPKILDMVEQLIGPDIALWNMSFFAKPALNGRDADAPGQRVLADRAARHLHGLDRDRRRDGGERVPALYPRLHRQNPLMAHQVKNDPNYTLNRELAPTEYDGSTAEDLILPAGGMAFHDVYSPTAPKKTAPPSPAADDAPPDAHDLRLRPRARAAPPRRTRRPEHVPPLDLPAEGQGRFGGMIFG